MAYDLTNIKLLLGITSTDKDSILQYLGNRATLLVTDCCRRKDVTAGMSGVIDDVVFRLYHANGYGSSDTPKFITSVKEDDTELQFKTVLFSGDKKLLPSEIEALAPYRKLWY